MIRTVYPAAVLTMILFSCNVFCAVENETCFGKLISTSMISGDSAELIFENGKIHVYSLEGGMWKFEVNAEGRKAPEVKCHPEPVGRGELKPAVTDVESLKSILDMTGLKDVCMNTKGGFSISFVQETEDHFYGLGELPPPEQGIMRMDRKGTVREVWNRHWAPADIPVNFFYNPRGYGFSMDNLAKGKFDFTGDSEWSFSAEGGRMRFYVIEAGGPAEAVEGFTGITGRPPLPPLWSLGFMQSRYGYRDRSEFEGLMKEFRSRGIPCDVLIFDIDWQGVGGMGNLEWNPQTFPGAEDFLSEMERQGFKAVTIIEPFLWTNTKYYLKVRSKKLLARSGNGSPAVFDLWGRPGSLLDFCNPDTREFWSDTVSRLARTGIDGWWTDLNEPDVYGDDLFFAGKTPHRLVHNPQAYLMNQAVRDGALEEEPDERVFIMSRSGSAGVASLGAFVWSGDVTSSFQHLRNQIPISLSAGMSGLPYWGSDIGGFNGHPSPELITRWFQFGMFCPNFRAHGNHDPREPWAYGPEAEKIITDTIGLRYRLLPYIYSTVREAHLTGRPVMRPMAMEFPELNTPEGWERTDAFMLGPSILAAPVMKEGARKENLILPHGEWFDFHTGRPERSGVAAVPAGEPAAIPMFVKAGSIIPMYTEAASSTGEIDKRVIELNIYPSWEFGYVLYEDDGLSNSYLEGEFAETRVGVKAVEISRGGDCVDYRINVGKTEGTYRGMPEKRIWKIVFHHSAGTGGMRMPDREIRELREGDGILEDTPSLKDGALYVPSEPGGFTVLANDCFVSDSQ